MAVRPELRAGAAPGRLVRRRRPVGQRLRPAAAAGRTAPGARHVAGVVLPRRRRRWRCPGSPAWTAARCRRTASGSPTPSAPGSGMAPAGSAIVAVRPAGRRGAAGRGGGGGERARRARVRLAFHLYNTADDVATAALAALAGLRASRPRSSGGGRGKTGTAGRAPTTARQRAQRGGRVGQRVRGAARRRRAVGAALQHRAPGRERVGLRRRPAAPRPTPRRRPAAGWRTRAGRRPAAARAAVSVASTGRAAPGAPSASARAAVTWSGGEERDGQRVAPQRGVLGGQRVLQRVDRRRRRASGVAAPLMPAPPRRPRSRRRPTRRARRARPAGPAPAAAAALRTPRRRPAPGQGDAVPAGPGGSAAAVAGGGRRAACGRRAASGVPPPGRPRRPAPPRARCGRRRSGLDPGGQVAGRRRPPRRPARRRRGRRRRARSAGPGPSAGRCRALQPPERGRGGQQQRRPSTRRRSRPRPAAAAGARPDAPPPIPPATGAVASSRRLILPGRSPAARRDTLADPTARSGRFRCTARRTVRGRDPPRDRSGVPRCPPPRPGRSRRPRSGTADGRPAGSCAACWNRSSATPGSSSTQLDVRSAGRRHTVRLVVDSDSGVGPGRHRAAQSRAASDELDQHEHLVGGSYTLEVTSPGVDRPLTVPRHWRRAHLRLVAVRTADGRRVRRAGRGGGRGVRHAAGRRASCARCATPTSRTPPSRSSSPPPAEAEMPTGRRPDRPAAD